MYNWFAWNVLFRLQEAVKRHPTFDILKEMEAAESLAAPELERLRAQKLADLIGYCYRHVPYIREVMQRERVQPSDIRGPEDLRLLPVMTKSDIRDHRSGLRSEIAPGLSQFTTGGSTGTPLIFDLGKRRVASRVACRQRVGRWWGVSAGVPEVALWGAPIELGRQDWIRELRDRVMRTRLLSAFEMNEVAMTRYLDIIGRGGFRQLFGYPSAVYLLCLHARRTERNLRSCGIRVVFVTGEVLYEYQRELISETLNCPVADGYGGRDSGFIAHQCPHGGMHILSDTVIVEILDEQRRPVPAGVSGEVVVTDLYSHEAPFVRYATGDIAALSERRCGCGRPLPLMEKIEGRSNDCIVAPDGRLINSLAVVYPLREVPGIEHYRICQKQTDSFHVQIVCGDAYDPEAGERHMREGWTSLLRTPVQVTFEYVPRIANERAGKFRHVVSEVAGGQAPAAVLRH